MNPFVILTEALRSIPAPVRRALLIVFALCVAGEFVLEEILGYDTGKTDEILLYIGGYLGVQSAANVKPEPEPQQGVNPGYVE